MLQGHDSHQLAKPDTSFISALRKSHPGCTVAVLTDQVTQIELPEGVRLFRHTIDRSKLGRNAYANYYQYLAQVQSCPVPVSMHSLVPLDLQDACLLFWCICNGQHGRAAGACAEVAVK